MIYVYRVRRLVKIVLDETNNPTDPIDESGGPPSVHHVLIVFQALNKKYTAQEANKILAIATGEKKYLKLTGHDGDSSLMRKIKVSSEGLILLRPSGFIRALAESVDAALLISVVALLVSILVAVFKH
jgi:hypothetical protein